MCNNSKIALFKFAFMTIMGIYIFNRNYGSDRWFAFVLFSNAIVRLLEYFILSTKTCGIINHLSTIGIFIVLLIQPISTMIDAYYFGDLVFDKRKLLQIIWIYGIITIGIAIIFLKLEKENIQCSLPNEQRLNLDFSGFLNNKFIKFFWILYFLVILLFFMSKPWYLGILIGAIFGGTLLLSVFFVKNTSCNSVISWMSIFLAILYIILSNIIRYMK